MAVPTFSVKDFDKFQHYKDRAPPWIKLYNSTLDSYEFSRLSDQARYHLLAIMLLASRSNNKIPYDPDWIESRIGATSRVNLDELVQAGFIELNQPLQQLEHVASTALAKRLSREEERREEGEREKKDAAPAAFENIPDQNTPPVTNPETELYREGRKLLGKSAGGLIKKLLTAKKGNIVQARAALLYAADTDNPREYIGGAIRSGEKKEEFDYYDPRGGYGDTHW
jgi:hypothetical protein